MNQSPNDINGQGRQAEGPKDVRVGGDADHAARPTDRVHVWKDHFDDFGEAQRDDGQVIALQSERRNADRQAREGGQQPAHQQRDREQNPRLIADGGKESGSKVGSEQGGRIGAHGHESGVAERELTGVAIDQVQAHGQDNVDADADRDVEEIRVDVPRLERGQQAQTNRPAKDPLGARDHQTFSTSSLPSNPAGRNSRIRINTANAIASRYVDQPVPATNVSTTPRIKAPRAAPGMFPMPPKTAATNAFRPGRVPINGSIAG